MAPYFVAVVMGVVVELGVVLVSGESEAWDSFHYWTIGYPVLAVTCGALGWSAPRRWPLWGVLPVAAQFATIAVLDGTGPLLPVGLLFAAGLCLPCLLMARIGAWGARRTRELEPGS